MAEEFVTDLTELAETPAVGDVAHIVDISTNTSKKITWANLVKNYVDGLISTLTSSISSHAADTTTHGTTGDVVGTSDTQTLTNKTLTSPIINTPTGDVVTKTGAETLTNKRNTPRVVSTTDDATAVIDIDITDEYVLTAIANATTFTLTGTPTDRQKLIVSFKDAGVAKALTWTGFTARGATPPTTTVAGKWHNVGFKYNATASTWDCVVAVVES